MSKNIFRNSHLCCVTNEIPGLGNGLRKIGEASLLPNSTYVIELYLFPMSRYFLRRDKLRINSYVLYSYNELQKCARSVGKGEVIPGTNYVRISFFDLKMTFYLRYSPTDSAYSVTAA